MNSRDRFLEVMNFNSNVRTLKYEYAFWGATLNRWYEEGLPKNKFIELPKRITTPTSSLYLTANSRNQEMIKKGIIPDGLAIFGGGVYWPTQGLPVDRDVENYFGFDKGIALVDVNQLFSPMFDIAILEETDSVFKYIDIDGVTRIYQKREATLPTAINWPVKDRKSWYKIKEERLNLDNIDGRFPENWDKLVSQYKDRDYPLSLGGYPHGFFGTLAHIMGYENLFYLYYDDPDLIKDILETFTNLWISIWQKVMDQVDVDMIQIFEDVSMGTGPMISPAIFKEFMSPYYKRVSDFAKSNGIKIILVDTDGDCNILIPLFIEAGVTGLYPMESSAGMDILAVRKKYPNLQIMGGISKYAVASGKEEIDKMLISVEELIKIGGYIPYVDHSVPPSVSWDAFKYYREKLNTIIELNRY